MNTFRCLITVRGNTTPGMVTLVGKNSAGVAISEETPVIPVPAVYNPIYNEEFTYFSIHSYATVHMAHIGLMNAQITLGNIELEQRYVIQPSLSEQNKEELRAMIRAEIDAHKGDIAREVLKEINRQTRLCATIRHPPC